jgi:2-C-methyl-D-erythritol 4-phosphate cytidylyltransferase
MRTAAIIVAAGSGSRFGLGTPKQFLKINGKSVIAHAIERFEAAPSVDSIVVVLAADRAAGFDISPFRKVSIVVAGGDSRAASVRNGLDALSEDTEIVAVHDGARPLVTWERSRQPLPKRKRRVPLASSLPSPIPSNRSAAARSQLRSTATSFDGH